jgi:signal transduction histidine kinase/DNA-binding response OmpR family regulator
LSFAFDPQGTAFAGSFGGGVWHKTINETTFKPFILSNNEAVQQTIVMDFAFAAERVWVATLRELFELSKSGEIVRTIAKSELINQGNIYGVMTLDSGNMLLATSNGLIKLDKTSLKQTLLNPADKNAPGCDDGMMDLTQDANNVIWYVSQALCSYDPTTGIVKSVSSHPLFVAGMTAIIALPDGRIVGQDGKIAIYDPKDNSVKTITAANGHFIDDSTQNFGAMALIDDQLVVALSKGLLWLDLTKAIPEELSQNPLFIKKLMVMNKPRAIVGSSLQSPLVFPYDEKVAFLDFEQVDFFNQHITHQVEMPSIIDTPLVLDRLNGFAIPTATEGAHQIKVFSSKDDKIINSLDFNIEVKPPYWRTPLAYALYVFSLLLTMFVIYSLRVKAIKRDNRRLESLVGQRTKELNISLQDKQRMFENISHEFRTPLTVIIGNTEALLKGEHNKRVGVVHNQSIRLLSLVEQLLKLAELKATKKAVQTVNLREFIPIQVNSLSSLCEQYGVTLQLTDTTKLPTVEIIDDSIMLIITNLVGNAIKYADRGTQIAISVDVCDNKLSFKVINQAESFDTEISKERFVRLDKSENRSENINTSGNGIGLAIMQEIANLNHGIFDINAKQGLVTAQIALSIKVVEQPTPSIPLEHSSELDCTNLTLATVMVVEDNPELREFITGILIEHFDVIACEDGAEALKQLQTTESLPDLVLTDVVMPNLNGLLLTQAIKNNDELRAIPVVILSAKDDLPTVKEGYQSLADDYITKPFNSDLLLSKLTNLISTLRAMKEKTLMSLLVAKVKPKTELETKIVEALEVNYSQEAFSVHLLAEHLAMSAKTLNRRLLSIYGLPFNQLLRDYRLEKAKDMLCADLSAKEVTFNCGFSSQAYFGQCFKAKFDISPALYKQQQ